MHVDEVHARLERLSRLDLRDALEAVGAVVEREAVLKIEEMGAVDTGRLRSSIAHRVEDDTVVVGTNVEYAIYVHEGYRTPHGKRVAGRPFLRAALQSARPHIHRILREVMRT